MEAKDTDRISDLLFKRKYTELIVTEQLRLDQAIDYVYRAGIREVVENQPHIDGKCTGDLECFCMVKPGECDDPYDRDNFPRDRMYPSDIAEGEGRLIFIPKAKLKEWGLK